MGVYFHFLIALAAQLLIGPPELDALTTLSFPFVLVASKCDIRNSDGPFEPQLDNYEIHRTSPESPRSQKMCIALVLRSVIGNKYGKCFGITAIPVYFTVYLLFTTTHWVNWKGREKITEKKEFEKKSKRQDKKKKKCQHGVPRTAMVHHVDASPRRGLEFSVRVRSLVLCRSAVAVRLL